MSFVATATAVESSALEAALAEAAAGTTAATVAPSILAADAAPTIMSGLGTETGIGALGTGLGGTGIGTGIGALSGTGAGGLGLFGAEGAGAGLGAGAGTGIGAGAGSAGAQQALLDEATKAAISQGLPSEAVTQGVPQITSGQAAGANVNIPTYANQGPQGPGVQLTQSTGPIEGTAYNPYSISPSSLPSGATTIQSGAKGLGGIGNAAVGTGEGNPSALERGWNSATKFVKGNPMASAIGLSSLSNAIGMNQPNVPQKKKVVGKYSMSPDFQGTFPTANVYRPSYTQPTQVGAAGGLMQGYAQGGIAALAGPEGPQGPQGAMYPQSQQVQTQYATPSQMPTSSSIIDSGYEAQTDPYTGEPTQGFASGGIASFKTGMSVDDQIAYFQRMNNPPVQEIQPTSPFVTQHNPETDPDFVNKSPYQVAAGRLKKIYAKSNVTPTVMPNAAPNLGTINLAPPATKSTTQDVELAAQGGIMSAQPSLGGYATGGNPRLLKGPGDGMSDSIPAVIGHKQPARLASGEFVIPADVVSHLGNGDTDAGAQHLQNMMGNIRKARTGNAKQGKQINASKFLPK